jgi:LSD1 subclass zinc finger protein
MVEMPEQEVEVKEKNFVCKGCGNSFEYEPGADHMKCPHCGLEQIIPQTGAQEQIQEHDFSELDIVASTTAEGFGTPTRYFKCDRCGAVTTLPTAVTAAKCTFCDSPVIVETPPVAGIVMPESLVPFKIDKKAAVTKYQTWLSGLWFRPGDLKNKAALADIHGLYAPHFTFDANASSRWNGEAGHYYYETELYNYKDANGRMQRGTRQVRKIRWEHRSGTHQKFYDDILVCASKGLPADIMNKIYPYDVKGLISYRGEYLSGFGAEVYTIQPKDAWKTAQGEIHSEERNECSRLLDGDTQRNLVVNTTLSGIKWKHLLLPAYVASYAYGSKIYRFMVNGQTGEVQGEAPLSWLKIGIVTAIVVAAVVALAVLLV